MQLQSFRRGFLNKEEEKTLLHYGRKVKETPFYTIYEVVLNDTRFVLFRFRYGESFLTSDNDDVVMKKVFLFEEELKLKLLLYKDNVKDPKLGYKADKVIIYEEESEAKVEKTKVITPEWSFLFKYNFKFRNVVLRWRKDGKIEIELSASEVISALLKVLGGGKNE